MKSITFVFSMIAELHRIGETDLPGLPKSHGSCNMSRMW